MTRLDCRQVEALLPPFVDGVAGIEDASAVEAHLIACPACRVSLECQRDVRQLLRHRCEALKGDVPRDLRVAVRRNADANRRLGLPGRVSALAMAATLVLAVTAALAWGTGRSSVLLAAQLTLDHLKCFMIDGDAHATAMSDTTAEATLRHDYGLDVEVPPVPAGGAVALVAVRRCLYGEGIVPHVLYRYAGEPVSLFVLPRAVAASVDITTFGRQARVLRRGEVTYVIVASPELTDVAGAIGLGAE